MIEALRKINILEKDKTQKNKLPYFISDVFHQLANALRIGIPYLDQLLSNTDTFVDAPFDLIDLEQSLNEDLRT